MAQARQATALLLRSVDYGEADRVATLFTREHGKLTGLAKGARHSRRRFAGLQPFCLMNANIGRRGHGLASLGSVESLRFPPGLAGNLEALACGYVLLELVDRFEQPEAPSPQAFDLLWASLNALGAGADAGWIRLSFSLQLLGLAGLAPDLGDCRACGRAWPFQPAHLSAAQSGWLCGACARPHGDPASGLSSAEAEALKSAALGSAHRPPVSRAAGLSVERLLEYHLGRSLRSVEAMRGVLEAGTR